MSVSWAQRGELVISASRTQSVRNDSDISLSDLWVECGGEIDSSSSWVANGGRVLSALGRFAHRSVVSACASRCQSVHRIHKIEFRSLLRRARVDAHSVSPG